MPIINYNGATAEIFEFCSKAGHREYHVIVHATSPLDTFQEQYLAVRTAAMLVQKEHLADAQPVMKRYFVSDATNQALFIKEKGAVSIIQQPPLDGTKVALWIHFLSDIQITVSENHTEYDWDGLHHLWISNMHAQGEDSHEQALAIFDQYVNELKEQRCTLADNCIRTWLFINDVDNRYKGMVRARNEVFAQQGLTDHFIASTGIAGRQADPRIFVQMDAYAIHGIMPSQIHYLHAADHLNRTSEYGVSFERGTYIDHSDRRHIFISGTASINNQGQVMHEHDIRRQTDRMLENVQALLSEAGATYADVAPMIVYLRDTADYIVVRDIYEECFPQKPVVFLLAPVCRPGWLIEMECMAVLNLA
jgi:enamine deaminase RidA (YjgF/YER057c/UK114 family)